MTFYNKVILIGNLAQNPDTRYAPNGSQVTRFALRIKSDRDALEPSEPQIVDVVAFESDPDPQGHSLSKGTWVLVEGKIQTRSWKTLEGQRRKRLEIIAEKVCPLKDGRPCENLGSRNGRRNRW